MIFGVNPLFLGRLQMYHNLILFLKAYTLQFLILLKILLRFQSIKVDVMTILHKVFVFFIMKSGVILRHNLKKMVTSTIYTSVQCKNTTQRSVMILNSNAIFEILQHIVMLNFAIKLCCIFI